MYWLGKTYGKVNHLKFDLKEKPIEKINIVTKFFCIFKFIDLKQILFCITSGFEHVEYTDYFLTESTYQYHKCVVLGGTF